MQRFGNIVSVLVAVCILGCTPQFANAQGEEPLAGADCTDPPNMRTLKTCCWGSDRTMIDDIADVCVKEVKEMGFDDELDEQICKYECIFNKTKMFTEEGTIDHVAVEKTMSKALDKDESLIGLMVDVFEACDNKVDWIIQKLPDKHIEKGECRPYANLMRLCVSSFGILYCPEEKWVNTDECNNIKREHEICSFDKMH